MRFPVDSIVDRQGLWSWSALFKVGADDAKPQRRGKRLLLALLAVALVGGVALLVAFASGHRVMGTSSELPWGVLIATYVFFVASTSGLCLVGSLGHVFGFKVFEPIARKANFLALVMLVVGFTVIASELERPFLLLKLAITSPNVHSPIWWMGALYGAYTVVIAAELFFLFTQRHRAARIAGVLSIIAAVAAQSNLGGVFSLAHARPAWYGSLVPVYFIAWSLVCGAALLALMVTLTDYFTNDQTLRPENVALVQALRKLLALFLFIGLFMSVWKTLGAVSGDHYHLYDVSMASLVGPLFVSFWLFEVFLGLVVPLTILLGRRGRHPGWVTLAAALPLLSIFVMRYNFVYSGQMFSLRPVVGRLGETLSYAPPFKGNVAGFLSYTPSIVEVSIVSGAIAAAALLFVFGLRALRLTPREGAVHE